MTRVSIATAKAHFSELISKAEEGETIDILRHGKLVAQLVPAQQTRKPIDIGWLQTFAETMPQTDSDTVRRMRDEERY